MLLTHPSSPQAAQALARKLGKTACFIAGGTLLQQSWAEPRLAPDATHFIHVLHWPETQQIHLHPDHLHIGAGMRLEAIRRHPLVQEHAPVLVQAINQLGALGVRHLGTLGGNIGWGEGDCCPVLLAMDAEVELTDGNVQSLEQTLALLDRPLMLAFRLPRSDAKPPLVFEKVGYRAAFSPARLRMALRWTQADQPLSIDRIAVAAPGIEVHRMQAVEKLLAYAHELHIRPTLSDIRATCQPTLPPELALIASRLIAGHCGLLS